MATIKVFDAKSFSPEGDFDRVLFVLENVDSFTALTVDHPTVKATNIDEPSLALLQGLAKDKLKAAGDLAGSVESFVKVGEKFLRVVLIILPAVAGRANAPSRAYAVKNAVKAAAGGDSSIVYFFSSKNEYVFSQVLSAGRAFSLYNLKSKEETKTQNVSFVANFPADSEANAAVVKKAEKAIEGIRLAQKLVDTPPNILHTDAYVDICTELAAKLNVNINVIKGLDLEKQGFGGLYGVGKAAEHLPALVVLSYYPQNATKDAKSIALVGKGIVYDTGGLSLKTPTTFMAGMKGDMGGSAAVLGSFVTAVQAGDLKAPLHAILCLAENAVGPLATRPDDIHTLLSGKTVEVNNTDAEGRLVLADGVFYASRDLNPAYIIDIATLTGAQLIATGKNHAAIYCNDDDFEALAIASGKYTGDLTFPVPYAPEFYRAEFKSQVADFKNSVADRGNAQVSCAGQFIGNNLEDFLNNNGKWLHVDMAGPGTIAERGTGYGVGLLFDIVEKLQSSL